MNIYQLANLPDTNTTLNNQVYVSSATWEIIERAHINRAYSVHPCNMCPETETTIRLLPQIPLVMFKLGKLLETLR